MKTNWKVLTLSLLVSLLMSGCASTQTRVDWSQIDKPTKNVLRENGTIEDGLYMVSALSPDRCSGPVHTFFFMYEAKTNKEGKQTIALSDKFEQPMGGTDGVGTCQQVVVGVAKTILPSVVELATGKWAANAIEHKANQALEASQYMVDHQKNPVFNEDNRIFMDSKTGVQVDVTGGFCGDRCAP